MTTDNPQSPAETIEPKTVQLFVCRSCGTEYRHKREAADCQKRAAQASTAINVGDIVLAKSGFGWYNGDRRWIANADQVDPDKRGNPGPFAHHKCPNGDTNCFGDCCTFTFYYVVTHIDREPRTHRVKYHLETEAMSRKEGYRDGYTFDRGHYTPVVVTSPPAHVVKESRRLIGNKTDQLL